MKREKGWVERSRGKGRKEVKVEKQEVEKKRSMKISWNAVNAFLHMVMFICLFVCTQFPFNISYAPFDQTIVTTGCLQERE